MNTLSVVLLGCIFFLLVILFITYFIKLKDKQCYKSLEEQFPSIPRYPLIGNLHLALGILQDLLREMEKIMEHHTRLIFWFGSEPILFLRKYDDIAIVSNQNLERDTFEFFHDWIGPGLLTSKYEEWKKTKKILLPAFSSEMLAKYVDVFNRKSAMLVESFRPFANTGEVINVFRYVIKTNLRIGVENMMNISTENRNDEMEKFGKAASKLFPEAGKRVATFWLYPDFAYRIYLRVTKKKNIINHFHDLPTKVLKEKLAHYRNEPDSFGNVDFSKSAIDLLIRGRSEEPYLTETRMRDELLTMIIGATDTTALNMSFLMLQLAINQDIQQKVYEDIVELLQKHSTLTADHLINGLEYLEQCIKETSRVYTHLVGTSRRIKKPCVLKDNAVIPANTLIVAMLHLVNNDAELYPDPHKWNPENFSKRAVEKRQKNTLASFGFGPRSCIGARYAILSIKTQIVCILRSYHLSTSITELTRNQLSCDTSIRSKIGYPIQFTRRQDLLDSETAEAK